MSDPTMSDAVAALVTAGQRRAAARRAAALEQYLRGLGLADWQITALRTAAQDLAHVTDMDVQAAAEKLVESIVSTDPDSLPSDWRQSGGIRWRWASGRDRCGR